MAQISYTNKVALNENPEIADINKVTDDDMNEIKQVVNDNYNNTIVISDTQPTSEDNKIWIDTGEVQNLGSEIHVGNTIDPNVLTNIIYYKDINFTTTGSTSGSYLNSIGTPVTSSAWNYTDYIEVTENTTYQISNASGLGNNPAICFYDSTKTFISGEAFGNATSKLVTTPNNTRYVRISYTGTVSNYYFETISTSKIFVNNDEIYTKGNQMYTTEEIKIGTWLGKPLYRKVITGTGATVTTQGTAVTKYVDIASNIEIAMIKEGYFNYSSVLFPLFFTNSSDTTKYCRAYIGKSTANNPYQLVLQSNATSYSALPFVAVIEYTKTTD